MLEVEKQPRGKKGFTIVELSLSIAFIGVLSIIVVVMIGNAVSAYHRGVTLDQLNTTGMSLVDEIRTAIQESPGRSLKRICNNKYSNTSSNAWRRCNGDWTGAGMSFVRIERKDTVQVGGKSIGGDVPVYGAFCTGKYSYLWNSGYFFNTDYTVPWANRLGLRYRIVVDSAGSSSSVQKEISDFKMVKVLDESRAVCGAMAGYKIGASEGNGSYSETAVANRETNKEIVDISSISIDEEPVEILPKESSLAVYSLTAAQPAEGGVHTLFYSMSLVLGTVQGGINVKASGNYCAAPEDDTYASAENFDYCAINKFNFAAQATGG